MDDGEDGGGARGWRLAAVRAAGRRVEREEAGKRLGGERYLQIRKLLIGHGDEVQWATTVFATVFPVRSSASS